MFDYFGRGLCHINKVNMCRHMMRISSTLLAVSQLLERRDVCPLILRIAQFMYVYPVAYVILFHVQLREVVRPKFRVQSQVHDISMTPSDLNIGEQTTDSPLGRNITI